MNDAEYKAFVQSASDGHVLIGVDRIFARKLYTGISTSKILKATGETPYVEKLVVWFAYLASPLAMFTSAILAFFTFRWWVLLVVPVMVVGWMFNSVFGRRGSSSIWSLTIVVIAALSVHFLHLLANRWLSGFVATFAFALWCDRLVYCASTFFLRAFILRNQRAFEAFGEGIRVRKAD